MRLVQKSVFLLVQIFLLSLVLATAQSLNKFDRALLDACEHNNQKAAKAALKAGANINAQNSMGVTPLIFATPYNDPQFMDLLLQAGAKVIIQDDHGTNALDALRPSSNGIKEKLEAAIAKDKALAEQLILAIFDGKTGDALDLLKAGAYIDFVDNRIKEHATPLMAALDKGNIELAKALLKAGARIERADNRGATALFYAAKRAETLKLLLAAGANINATLKDGEKPIHVATNTSNTAIVQLLIDAGADVNSADVEGYSPLHYAALAGDAEMIKFLLSKNADPKKETALHMNLLHIAIDNGHPEIVPILLKAGVDANKKAGKGYTPLMIAAANGDLASTNLLLQSGANVDLTDNDGETALVMAQKYKQTEVVAVLTKSTRTQPVEQTISEMKKEIDSDQVKVLFKAVSVKYNGATVAGLLKNGFSPNLKNEKGETALMIATDNDDGVTMNLLLDFGADINAQDNTGMTALMRAVSKDLLLPTANLLKKGAKKDIKDKQGRTALSIAKEVDGTVLMVRKKELE